MLIKQVIRPADAHYLFNGHPLVFPEFLECITYLKTAVQKWAAVAIYFFIGSNICLCLFITIMISQ
ncbi:hypothetical protein P343_04695 [Sporolactobacillus laevolacticus DSM 442]|uniref:Uncharacterized protein n=1 Tax=Sporolactobacillus laevolacticus DSM 442 TaxID=1395513 RepID=V6IZN5_9BACL|nr:hypothetical protein P343_04695 [Sporolactobacillus laevolacticus DSM 442]